MILVMKTGGFGVCIVVIARNEIGGMPVEDTGEGICATLKFI